jgi:hypothetical protein
MLQQSNKPNDQLEETVFMKKINKLKIIDDKPVAFTLSALMRCIGVLKYSKIFIILLLAVGLFSPQISAQLSFTAHNIAVNSDFSGAHSVNAVDLDGDGDVDILGAAQEAAEIAWWENDGDKGFIKHTIDTEFDGANSVCSVDMDGDGDIDILASAEVADEIAWWENDGNKGFTKHFIDRKINGPASVYPIDVDSDGKVDVLATAQFPDWVVWYRNTDGVGKTWDRHIINSRYDEAWSVYATDVDGDDDVDILTTARAGNQITWWENKDTSVITKFSRHILNSEFNGASSVYALDMDSDGDVDILGAAQEADEVAWWENDGAQGFKKHIIEREFDGAYSVYAVDLDGDGDMDVLGAAQEAAEIAWWENDGTQGFTKHTIAAGFDGASSVYASDINGDGGMDVLGAAYGSNNITWWELDLASVEIDVDAPGFSSVSATDGTYAFGKSLTISVVWDERVIVSGTPSLKLSNGTAAVYSIGSGTSELVFTLTVAEGDSARDLGVISYSGTITDKAGNAAGTVSGNLGNVIIDGVFPLGHFWKREICVNSLN